MGTFGWLDSTMGIDVLISIAAAGFFVILAVSSAQLSTVGR